MVHYGSGLVGPERPAPDEGPWVVWRARPYKGRGGEFMMASDVIRAERQAKVLGMVGTFLALVGTFGLIAMVVTEVINPEYERRRVRRGRGLGAHRWVVDLVGRLREPAGRGSAR